MDAGTWRQQAPYLRQRRQAAGVPSLGLGGVPSALPLPLSGGVLWGQRRRRRCVRVLAAIVHPSLPGGVLLQPPLGLGLPGLPLPRPFPVVGGDGCHVVQLPDLPAAGSRVHWRRPWWWRHATEVIINVIMSPCRCAGCGPAPVHPGSCGRGADHTCYRYAPHSPSASSHGPLVTTHSSMFHPLGSGRSAGSRASMRPDSNAGRRPGGGVSPPPATPAHQRMRGPQGHDSLQPSSVVALSALLAC